MLFRFIVAAMLCLSGNVVEGQAQLQLVAAAFFSNSTHSFNRALPLPNGDTLLIGTKLVPGGAPGLLPAEHFQISLAVAGAVPFQNGEPPDLLPVLGGSGNDVPSAAVVDAGGNIWIAGSTDSDDFNLVNPIVSRKIPYRADAFVVELDPTGSNLLFSTYLAGKTPPSSFCFVCYYSTSATAIATDPQGNVYVGGSTNEADFPTTPGAFMTSAPNAGSDDFYNTYFYSWAAKISPTGKLIYSTFIGTGSSGCFGGSACMAHESTSATVSSMAALNSGALTVAGVKSGSFNLGSGYVARLSADGSALLWSSTVNPPYAGAAGVPALLMAQDSSGTVKLLGTYVNSVSEPGLPSIAGTPGLFVQSLSSNGSMVISSVDLGQSSDASAAGIALDASGNVYVAGTSSAPGFPTLADVPNLGSDFILGLRSSDLKPDLLIRLPHGSVSAPFSFDAAGDILLPGSSGAGGTLLTIAPDHVFDTPGIVAIADSASYDLNKGITGGELISLFGFDFGKNPQVLIGGLPAKVLYAGANQINAQVPFETEAIYSSGIQVLSGAGNAEVPGLPLLGAIGIFTTDGIHAAALNEDGTVNSASNPAASGSVVTLFGTGALWPAGTPDGAVASSAAPLNDGFRFVDADGSPTAILYAGTAPGLLYGVFQLNVQLPAGVALPLRLQSDVGTTFARTSNAVQIYLH